MKKRMLALLSAMLLMVMPALAEEADEAQLQAAANVAYARVLLEGESYLPVTEDARQPGEWKPVRFTLLDIEGDGLSEVIVELTEWEAFVVLTCMDGVVYGGEIAYRGMLNLKDDGTCEFSSGAMNNGVSKLCFAVDEETGKPVSIGRFNLAESIDTDGSVTYWLDCGAEQTDEAGYEAFLAQQTAKLDALWYDYTEENVKLLLGQ